MKLLTLEIKNYRGILNSGKIHIPSFLLLMGPNNSGKSTILKSLDIIFNDADFDPNKDYPRHKAGKMGYRATTKFKLTLGREPGEKLGRQLSSYIVKRKISDKFQDVITIELEYPRKYSSLDQRKIQINNNSKHTGRAQPQDKYFNILQLIRKRISYTYIPALRLNENDKTGNKVISQLFDFVFSHSQIYKKNHKSYFSSIASQLVAVKKSIKKSIAGFPEIKEINFDFDNINFSNLGIGINTSITAKNKIPLDQEGTGLQSALVIAIIRYILLSQEKKKGAKMIVGIEEPEVFLHPSAQRALINTVKHSQALISTHSPIILDELSPKEFVNILRCKIKGENRFLQLSSLSDIKLLTELYENSDVTGGEFFFSEKIILVEGTTDRAILKKQLRRRNYFSSAIIQVGGSTRFGKPLKLIKQFDLPIILLVDEDCFTGGNKDSFRKALVGEGLITVNDWPKLVKSLSVNLKHAKGSLTFFNKSKKTTQLDGIFVFPNELEPALISEMNVNNIINWLLSYGKKRLNLLPTTISELSSINAEASTFNKVRKMKILISGGDLKKRFIIEQMFDMLINENLVPPVFENLTEAISEKIT
jgi:predicted ATP-dependent endonuclease of OLD family